MIADWGTGVRWWGWLPGIVATAVFWALVIWAIVVLARWARSGGNGPAGPDGPRDTGGPGDDGDGPGQAQARRYVAGEIGAVEYHRHAGALRSRPYAHAGPALRPKRMGGHRFPSRSCPRSCPPSRARPAPVDFAPASDAGDGQVPLR